MTKEIYICDDGILIIYRYPGKTRKVTHPFYKPFNGKMVEVYVDRNKSMKEEWEAKVKE